MKLVTVFRWSPGERLLRVARLIRYVEPVGFGGFSEMLSLAINVRRRPVSFRREPGGWMLSIGWPVGIRMHWQRSFGGRHV